MTMGSDFAATGKPLRWPAVATAITGHMGGRALYLFEGMIRNRMGIAAGGNDDGKN